MKYPEDYSRIFHEAARSAVLELGLTQSAEQDVEDELARLRAAPRLVDGVRAFFTSKAGDLLKTAAAEKRGRRQ